MDFLHPDNMAGQHLLVLTARGSAIIAELLRLSDHIPSVFRGSPENPGEREKYMNILFDFRYLKNSDAIDEKIDSDAETVDLDEEFKETHMQLLGRFYQLFESIYRYFCDFQAYLEEMAEGVFVQHTIEGVLLDVEGRQLMCEALYLYGVMLLLLDARIPGPTREMMIVSYYRYKGAATISNIDEVCKLCRSSGMVPGGKRPLNYPEEYFSRYCIKKPIVEMIIGRLRTDDIYKHSSAYPAPEHRSTSLAKQAAMLYVVCFFLGPPLLDKTTATMREIVDKFFADNWVIAFYMGFTVDLIEAWSPYKAARKALDNITKKSNVEDILVRHTNAMPGLLEGLNKYLTEGVLTDEYCLNNIRQLTHHVRNCNVTLQWFLLHRTTDNKVIEKKTKDRILQSVSVENLMNLMMYTAQFEWKLKTIMRRILDTKQTRWEECKREGIERMKELAQYFSGEMQLARVKKNENLQAWCNNLAVEIGSLDFNHPVGAGRKISQLSTALDDVQEFHQVEASLQVKQFLLDTKGYLQEMIRTVNVSEKTLADLDIVSDFSYAWHLINEYTPLMHHKIKTRPASCLLLRSTFVKLSSILSAPLVRITQCDSRDSASVAEYYSTALVMYVRKVLDIIPKSVFKVLDSIIRLQATEMKQLPTKLERKYLKDLSQLEQRYTLANYTHQVSVFTEGILAMKTTLVGIIKLDPRQLLEDGVRKELVLQHATAMNECLVFRTGTVQDFEGRLNMLGAKLDGFRQSFEYIQDYINVYGLRILQQEFSRIINFNVEQESNSFLKKKIYPWQSTYQSEAIPIPVFPSEPQAKGGENSVNFMGRLVREVLNQTHPARTVYVESLQGWYDAEREVIGIRTFSLLHRGVGVFGLTGMDRLLCFMIVRDLSAFVRLYRKTVEKQVLVFIQNLSKELTPTSQFPPNTQKLYMIALQKTQKLWPQLLDFVTKIGTSQLIRRQIANELNFSCKMDSHLLFCTLDTLNRGLINDVEAHYNRPESKPYPGNPLLPDLSNFLETAGINNPITKIYITTEPLEGLPCLLFLFVLSQVMKLEWNPVLNTMVSTAKSGNLDGAPLVVGVITILKQFHSSHTHTFLGYLGQYVRSNISANGDKAAALPQSVSKVLLFLEEFCKFNSMSRKAIDAIVPSYIFDRFAH